MPAPFMKVQMKQADRAVPGSGGYLVSAGSAFIPYDAEEVARLRGHGYEVVRAWWVHPDRDWTAAPVEDVRWPSNDGPVCGCCGQVTIPPTEENEQGFYCEGCGIAWTDPTLKPKLSCELHRTRVGSVA